MSEPLLDITVADGKYRIVQHSTGLVEAFRYGETWLTVTNTPGSNMILAMAYELEELRARVGRLDEDQYLLISLAEECAEVTQRVTKALRFGLGEVQPGQELTNAQRIAGENTDLLTIMSLLERRGVVPYASSCKEKEARVQKFMDYAREQGTLA